jgi:isopentenyl-diphosphate delta-isomerase
MADEIFDVVNERDEAVGRASRRQVHAQGLMHRAVHVLVFDANGRVFLQKRSMLKDMCPGLWDSSCSGHVDAGEDYDFAAARELGEELGLREVSDLGRWFRVDACNATGNEFCWVYRLSSSGPFVLHPEEIDGGEWCTLDELSQRIAANPQDYCPAFKLIWSIARTRL